MPVLNPSSGSPILVVGSPGADGKSTYQSWIEAGNTGTEAEFLASLKGQDGRDGKDGLGTLATRIADVTIPPNTCIVDIGNGRCAPADPRVTSHRGALIGFSAAGASQGALASAGTIGPFAGIAAGAFAPDATLYISDGTDGTHLGGLTDTVPSRDLGHTWTQTVGRATGATSANFERGPALLLSDGAIPYSPTAGFVLPGYGADNYLPGNALDGVLDNVLALDTPLSLPADINAALGSPAVIETADARLNVLAYPKAKLLLAQGDAADWRPLFEAVFKLGRPLYFGPNRYFLRSRTPGSANVVGISAPVSVDVLCHPGATFLVHERVLRSNPTAYDANPSLPRDNAGILFAFDTGLDRPGPAGGARYRWKWHGGRIDWTPNLATSTQGVGLMSGWDISRYDTWELKWAVSEGGRTAPVLASIGAGFPDTGFSNHGCGPGKVDLCWFEGSRDEGVYLSGVVNQRIGIAVNAVRFDTSLGTGCSITLDVGASASPGDVFSLEDTVIGAVTGVGTEADAGYVRAQAGTRLRGLYTAIAGSSGRTLVIRAETAPWSYPTYEAQAGTTYYADRSIRLFNGTYYRCVTTHTTASSAFDATKWGPLNNATDNPVQRNAVAFFASKDERDAISAMVGDPRGQGHKIVNSFFVRNQNAVTMKRNGPFLEVAGNHFEENGGNILAGSVGYTNSSGTDYLSHGKRFSIHDNVHLRTQGYAISLTNSTGAHIYNERIIDFGRWISNPATFTSASRNIAAVMLTGCADCSVRDLYIANETPSWSAGMPTDFGKAPIGVYLASDPIYLKKSCTNCVVDSVRMRNVSWPLVSEAGGRENLVTNVPLRGLHRNTVLQGIGDTYRGSEDLRMSFTPGERRHVLEMPGADPSRVARLFQGIAAGERAGPYVYAAWYGDSVVAREDGTSFVIVARSKDRWLTKEIIGYIDATDPYLASKDPRVFLDRFGQLWIFIAQADYSPDRPNAYGVWAAICENPADATPIIGTPFQLSPWGVPTRPLRLQDGRTVMGLDMRDRPYVDYDQAVVGGSTLFELDLIGRKLIQIARLPQIANVATDFDFPEGSIAQAPNGELIYVIRTMLGQQISRSTANGAQGSWSPFTVWTALGDNPNSRAAACYLPSGNLAVAYNNFPGTGSNARQKMSVRISTDRGATFGPAYVLVNGIGSSYPDIVVLSSTEFAVVTDRNRSTDCEIRQVNLTEAIVASGTPIATDPSVLSFISRPSDWGG